MHHRKGYRVPCFCDNIKLIKQLVQPLDIATKSIRDIKLIKQLVQAKYQSNEVFVILFLRNKPLAPSF